MVALNLEIMIKDDSEKITHWHGHWHIINFISEVLMPRQIHRFGHVARGTD
jgi:hypothetical protein